MEIPCINKVILSYLILSYAFASNHHFRSTLALEFKPFSFLCILSDVDECANKSHDCDVNAYCNNTVGSYRCTCNSWYQGNGTSCYFREFHWHWDTSDLCLLWCSHFAFSIFLYRHMKLKILEIYFFNMSRSWIETKMEFVLTTGYIMTLYSLASVQIFSSLFSIHTIWYCQGNLFDNQELSFIPIILMFDLAVIR